MRNRLLWLLLGAVVLGAGASAASTALVNHLYARPENLHDLVHKRFHLDPQEQARLEAAEARYEQRRSAIEGDIAAANRELAEAIRKDPEMSAARPGSDAVERSAAELQRVTLAHIFEMRAALAPEHRRAYDAVLVDALTHGA